MSPKKTQHHEPGEIPLAYDAATWDDDSIDSGWDDEEVRLVGELARAANE